MWFWIDTGWASRMERKLDQLLTQGERIMVTQQEGYDNVKKQLGELGTAVGSILTRVLELQNQGSPVTGDQLQEIADSLDGFQKSLDAASGTVSDT